MDRGREHGQWKGAWTEEGSMDSGREHGQWKGAWTGEGSMNVDVYICTRR